MKTYQITIYVERNEQELELEIFGNVTPYVRARTYGAPEDCYPAEGGEVEIEKILLNNEVWAGELDEQELDEAEVALFNAANDDDNDRGYDAEMERDEY